MQTENGIADSVGKELRHPNIKFTRYVVSYKKQLTSAKFQEGAALLTDDILELAYTSKV